VFYLVVATGTITIFGSMLVEWRSLKVRAEKQMGESGKPKESTETETKESV